LRLARVSFVLLIPQHVVTGGSHRSVGGSNGTTTLARARIRSAHRPRRQAVAEVTFVSMRSRDGVASLISGFGVFVVVNHGFI